MISVDLNDARNRFADLITRVDGGETVTITRDGVALARIVPAGEHGQRDAEKGIAAIRELRQRIPKASREEIKEWVEEGRF